jgi:hypothetical protein
MPRKGTVLLVEADREELIRLGQAIEDAGYAVMQCPGPSAPDYVCIGGRESSCPLVERADVVVLDPWLAGDAHGVGTSADDLVELYSDRGRTVILLGSAGWVEAGRGNVVRLRDRPEAAELVDAIRDAPGAAGFVLRSW